MELTTKDQRKAARLLRRIADHASESLHFSQRAQSASSRARWEQRAFDHSGKHLEAVHELAHLLDVDIETRKERA